MDISKSLSLTIHEFAMGFLPPSRSQLCIVGTGFYDTSRYISYTSSAAKPAWLLASTVTLSGRLLYNGSASAKVPAAVTAQLRCATGGSPRGSSRNTSQQCACPVVRGAQHDPSMHDHSSVERARHVT